MLRYDIAYIIFNQILHKATTYVCVRYSKILMYGIICMQFSANELCLNLHSLRHEFTVWRCNKCCPWNSKHFFHTLFYLRFKQLNYAVRLGIRLWYDLFRWHRHYHLIANCRLKELTNHGHQVYCNTCPFR